MGAQSANQEDPSFMTGSWTLSDPGGNTVPEEVWLAPAGDPMVEMNRVSGGFSLDEFLRIERRDTAVFYVARSVDRGETEFELIESASTFAVFQNLAHHWPQGIRYERDTGGLQVVVRDLDGNRLLRMLMLPSE